MHGFNLLSRRELAEPWDFRSVVLQARTQGDLPQVQCLRHSAVAGRFLTSTVAAGPGPPAAFIQSQSETKQRDAEYRVAALLSGDAATRHHRPTASSIYIPLLCAQHLSAAHHKVHHYFLPIQII